jgi:SAM-dependent methyltransferase
MPGAALRGFDINAKSIEVGRAKWGLTLDVADEAYLSRLDPGSVDVFFTVSVLDHLPAIEGVLADIARVIRGYYVAIEPFPEEALRYLDVFKRDGAIREAVTTETPFSYLHPYDQLAPAAGLVARLDVPMPPYAANWGPLYRLTVYEKAGTVARFTAWDQLRDELMFAAVRAAR